MPPKPKASAAKPAKPAAPKPAAPKPAAPRARGETKALTKSQLVTVLAEGAGQGKGVVKAILEELTAAIAGELRAGRPFTLPGLVKIVLQRKKATPARPGKNPFTGEMMTFKAKPARNVVRVRPAKALKDMASA